jgi:hypothetical protein
MNKGEHGKNYNKLLWRESFLAIYVILNMCNKATYALTSMCTMFFFFFFWCHYPIFSFVFTCFQSRANQFILLFLVCMCVFFVIWCIDMLVISNYTWEECEDTRLLCDGVICNWNLVNLCFSPFFKNFKGFPFGKTLKWKTSTYVLMLSFQLFLSTFPTID